MPLRLPVYLDYAATTPVDSRVAQAMLPWLTEKFGNATSRSHAWGWEAEKAIECARGQVAELIGAQAREIIWTSGATEANNLAIKGAAQFYKTRGKHIVTIKTEHKAVLDSMHTLEQQGFEVTYLEVQENGLVDAGAFQDAIRPDTILASVMLVNNEIGVIQDIATLGAICRQHGVVFHVDAAQAAGKIPIDVSTAPVDLMSLASHKIYGPKGIGALYVQHKPRVRLEAQIHGGGHERGMRSGTLATHQCVGMGEAFRLAKLELQQDYHHASQLQQRLITGLQAISSTHINGDMQQRIPHNLNISFACVDGENFISGMPNLALSSGSACISASLEPSYVLRALGCSDALAYSSLRITVGRFSTAEEIDYAIAQITEQVAKLRALNPLWAIQQSKAATSVASH